MNTPRQQFGSVRLAVPLFDLAQISNEFCRAVSYSLEGVTAMLCGLHARLCHAFLVVRLTGMQNLGLHLRLAITNK